MREKVGGKRVTVYATKFTEKLKVRYPVSLTSLQRISTTLLSRFQKFPPPFVYRRFNKDEEETQEDELFRRTGSRGAKQNETNGRSTKMWRERVAIGRHMPAVGGACVQLLCRPLGLGRWVTRFARCARLVHTRQPMGIDLWSERTAPPPFRPSSPPRRSETLRASRRVGSLLRGPSCQKIDFSLVAVSPSVISSECLFPAGSFDENGVFLFASVLALGFVAIG